MSDATRESLRDLAPGYVLGALSPEETKAFEAALAGSAELQREVAEFREVSGLLALRDEQAPAAELKQRLRERIAAAKTAEIRSAGSVRSAPRSHLLAVALGAGLAASLLLSIGLFLKTRALEDTVAQNQRRLAEREATLNELLEPAVQLTTLTATGEAPPVVQVFWNRTAHLLTLHTFRLKPAPAGRVYQLWLLRKQGNPIPSALFTTEESGHQLVRGVRVPADEEIGGFALTLEPAGGSPQPTSTPIVFGNAGGI
ncbi:MAG TPA: anti-sigma factor [Gemmatimonadales bacterium]|jgi:anti-sigma-K factor RskA|nr:anti-sigma factor [Gemmatimonadales bacterium]